MQKLSFPNFAILEFGNPYSGSAQKINYKMKPKDGQIVVTMNINYNPDSELSNEFPLTQEGYGEAQAWLEEQYQGMKVKV